jgi:hypothetical protein
MLKRRVRHLAATALTIVSASVLVVLGAAGASAAPVAAAVTWASTGGSAIVNYNHSSAHGNMCLGVSWNDANSGAVLWPCSRDGQTWYTGAVNSAGYYQIYWLRDGVRQCLGVGGGSTASGARVFGWKCLGTTHPDQYWKVVSGLNSGCPGYNYIFNYKSGKVLGVTRNSTAAGAYVVIFGDQKACNNQQWLAGTIGSAVGAARSE